MSTTHFFQSSDEWPACACGFRNAAISIVMDHIDDHATKLLTTIPAADASYPAGLEVRDTPRADEHDAIEIIVVSPAREGAYHQQAVYIRRSDIPFLIDQLEAHRLGKNADPCPACAAHAFAARLTDSAMKAPHTCPGSV